MTFARVHLPCPDCGSSDALARRQDGSSFCFSCERNTPSGGRMSTSDTRLLEDVRFASLRGITEETCRRYGYGLARVGDATVQVAPYHDQGGTLVAQKLRYPDKRFVVRGDMAEARLFGERAWPASGRMVVVTEGEIDAMSASQAQGDWPAVSVPSGASSAASAVRRSLDWLSGFDRVVLAFDEDEPGQRAALAAAAVLPPGKAYVAHLPRKDSNECLTAGLSTELKRAFWNARPWRPDGILDSEEAWTKAAAQDSVPSYPWGLPALDARTKGFRPGEVVVVTGGTGSGKTTLVQQTVVDLLAAGVPVGLLSLEAPIRRVVLDLCSVARAAPRQEEMTEENHAAWTALSERLHLYQHFGSTETGNVVARMRYMARALGCRVLVLDHLSIVVSGFEADSDERRSIDRLMTQVATLAQEVEAAILVVSHLRRPDKGAHEEGGRVTLADLRGSGSIAQLAHTVVAVERDQQSPDTRAALRVLKCRHTGDLGLADQITYVASESRVRSSWE